MGSRRTANVSDFLRTAGRLLRRTFRRRVSSDFDTVRSMPLVQAVASGLLAVGLIVDWNPPSSTSEVFGPRVWLVLAVVGVPAGVWAWWRGPTASFVEAAAPGFLLMAYGFGRAFALIAGENVSARPWLAGGLNMILGIYSAWLWMLYYMPTHHAHHHADVGRGHLGPWQPPN